MFDLSAFSAGDMVECGAGIRRVAEEARSAEEAAGAIARYLHHHLVDKTTGEPSCALVRYYQTRRFDQLEPDLRDVAAETLGGEARPSLQCLALLGTAGSEPEWNDRRASRDHSVLPLVSGEMVRQMPMVHQLFGQLGVEVGDVVEPHPELLTHTDQRAFNVFHVGEAIGSPHIPAQDDFVVPYGIRSVLGFGGWLPSGDLFVVILFCRVPVAPDIADLFRSVALSVKLAMLPFGDDLGLTDVEPAPGAAPAAARRAAIRAASLEQLLTVSEQTVREQFLRLEQALAQSEDRAAELAQSRVALEATEALKSAILSSALDCVVTMDEAGRIVEFNPAAEQTFGHRRDEVVGRELADVIIPPALRDAHRAGLARYLATGEGPVLGRRIEITGVRRDGSEFPVELTVTRVQVPGPAIFTGYLRDITREVSVRKALQESSERFAHVARTLQASLLPPHLPEIPGLELAATYSPAGDGIEVGGDFYDVFQTANGEWCCVVGDVCGKGPEAAAVTALARYTLRTAAMRESRPSRVLNLLNEAMLRQHPERFCTVVHGRLGDRPGGLRLTMSCGGHPLPLLVRPDGTVTELGTPGTAVGLFPDPDLTDSSYDLDPGDTVVFYTDGLIEVRGPGWEGAEAVLHAELAASTGDDVATVANRVSALRSRVPLRWSDDDVAVLVVRAAPDRGRGPIAGPDPDLHSGS